MAMWIEVEASDGHKLSAYVAEPEQEAKGGVVLVQEIFGINSHIRSVADAYARQGFKVVAPALFDRLERDVQLDYTDAGMKKAFELYGKLKPESALLDVAAAFEDLNREQERIAVLGFCYGGLMAWLAATRGPSIGMKPRCTVGYYAGGIGHFAQEEPSCPVMLHFGENDTHIDASQVEAVRSAHPDVQVFTYAEAGHAFNRSSDPNSYHAEAAALAQERSLAFLHQKLG